MVSKNENFWLLDDQASLKSRKRTKNLFFRREKIAVAITPAVNAQKQARAKLDESLT